MKTHLLLGLASLALSISLPAAEAVTAKLVKITEAPSKSLATVELHNGHSKGLKSYKAMLVLKDGAGKVVDVQSRWLLGGGAAGDPPEIIPTNKKKEVNVTLTSQRSFKQVEIIPSRIILEDGTVINPPPSVSAPKGL